MGFLDAFHSCFHRWCPDPLRPQELSNWFRMAEETFWLCEINHL